MLKFNKQNSEQKLIVTLTEKVTIENPFFLFVFTNVTTKKEERIMFLKNDDESEHINRYNMFTIDCTTIFAQSNTGQYQYQVYEVDESYDGSYIDGLNMLECGKMILFETTENIYTGYDPTTIYNG